MSKMTLKKYDEYYDSVKEDKTATAKIKANEIREKNVNNMYDQIASSAANAYKDSVAKVDRQKSQAMQDANALNERLARYILEVNQRMGVGGTGMSDTLTLETYAKAASQRRDISDMYDAQKNDMFKAYQDAATARELEKASKLNEIDISNVDAMALAAEKAEAKAEAEKEKEKTTQATNLGTLGQGFVEGGVSFQDYVDYYNKVSDSLDEDDNALVEAQHKAVLKEQYARQNGTYGLSAVKKINGKYYTLADEYGNIREVQNGELTILRDGFYKYQDGKWVKLSDEEMRERGFKSDTKKSEEEILEEIKKMQGKYGNHDPNYFYVP